MYATIQAVETFVDRHYGAQLELIDALQHRSQAAGVGATREGDATPDLQSLRDLLESCRLDEVSHRDDAAARLDGPAGRLLSAWQWTVGRGSESAVHLCRYI